MKVILCGFYFKNSLKKIIKIFYNLMYNLKISAKDTKVGEIPLRKQVR